MPRRRFPTTGREESKFAWILAFLSQSTLVGARARPFVELDNLVAGSMWGWRKVELAHVLEREENVKMTWLR
jgi:hypothetical protein